MSNVTRLPPFPKMVHVEADIPVSQRDEFERAIIGIVAGERPHMEALERDENAIEKRANGSKTTILIRPNRRLKGVTSRKGKNSPLSGKSKLATED